MIRSVIAAVALAALTGCMTMPRGPGAAQLAEADYGQPIAQDQAEFLARQFMAGHLKDPQSATWSCSPVAPQYVTDGVMYGGSTHFGWGLECGINAKNSFGGYVGARTYQFLFRDGRLVTAYGERPLSGGGSYMQRIL